MRKKNKKRKEMERRRSCPIRRCLQLLRCRVPPHTEHAQSIAAAIRRLSKSSRAASSPLSRRISIIAEPSTSPCSAQPHAADHSRALFIYSSQATLHHRNSATVNSNSPDGVSLLLCFTLSGAVTSPLLSCPLCCEDERDEIGMQEGTDDKENRRKEEEKTRAREKEARRE
jgi:hypothetical protein